MTVAMIRERARRTSTSADSQEQSIDSIWRRYKQTLDEPTRNWLVERYFPLVCSRAERLHARLPRAVDLSDLIQQGSFGLLDAISAFDPDHGAKFETFCIQRVNGAMVDYLRSIDDASRGARTRYRMVQEARQKFFASHGYNPTDLELLPLLHPQRKMAQRILDGSALVRCTCTSDCWRPTETDRDEEQAFTIEDASQPDALSVMQKRDIRNFITRGLSRVERLIVVLYYYEELSMKEIGHTLGLSESRVSQMHKSVLARLRAQLGHRERELVDA
ncbi:MAG: FliA/WhiG family RNA polymerase sigma factor [Phycisphaerales bacterium]|nr:FliA/WhiG family RNA polymerase sigma factor [Phycisphaerales bacterium]